ncbi:glycosyltransferase family 4 protein [Nocardioides cynanchi]|uniref:glycosyltransferase family 4 protein n=1 Tax=Nocardioides cynanchi TaxID=2558918 RepID=UPI001EE37881|nr:glycosyltransferase family 4 protein [Nocardioides cynanchi]
MAEGLAARGARVTVFSAAHAGAPPEDEIRGVRYVRRGSKLSVYARGMQALGRGDLGDPDLVVDVQNGLPFFSRLVTRRPVVVLVHHVHREQWPVVYPGFTGTVGWWIERRLAPLLYRRCQYVTGSRATRDELAQLGVDPRRIAVVHYGTDRLGPVQAAKTSEPSICVVGRLVPHKQVEHAIDAVLELRKELPGTTLTVVGSGWWEAELHAYAAARDAGDAVRFLGQADEATREQVYEESWVLALPSLKEGWGLVVGEAALAGTPTVAYASAGGTRESVVDGVSGLLVDDQPEFVDALRRLLTDHELRARLAEGARTHGGRYTWDQTRAGFADVVRRVLAGERVSTD